MKGKTEEVNHRLKGKLLKLIIFITAVLIQRNI